MLLLLLELLMLIKKKKKKKKKKEEEEEEEEEGYDEVEGLSEQVLAWNGRWSGRVRGAGGQWWRRLPTG